MMLPSEGGGVKALHVKSDCDRLTRMQMLPRIVRELSYRHFEQMTALELLYYDEEFITPTEESYRWYTSAPYTTLAAMVGDEVVGFVNLFPVKPEVFSLLLSGELNDHDMTTEAVVDLAMHQGEPLDMFLSCIVVGPEYRGTGLSLELLRAAVAQYAPVQHCCRMVLTDNVTPAGEAFSRRLGFSFQTRSNHDSCIYTLPYTDFIAAIIPRCP